MQMTTRADLTRWTERLIAVALAVPLVILALLVAALLTCLPARADDMACTGRNLLPEARQKDPKAYANFQAEAAKVPNGHSIFWKIEKAGVSPSFLLGTMHVTDPRVLAMPKGAPEAASGADTIIVESDEVLDDKKAATALLAKPELSMFTDGTTITSRLTAEQKTVVEAGLKQRGLALLAVNRMKPWILASFFAQSNCEKERKAEGQAFLDQQIAETAAKAGKQVVGVETYAEQLAAMNDLPMEFHMKSMVEAVELGDKIDDINETTINLYLQGKVGEIMPALELVAPDAETAKKDGHTDFDKRIITDRNKVMAERATPYLDKGKVFMAVGALHLPGEGGLVALLRAKGFTVTPAP
ncbi:TraB/GumN family protein [Allorhizobium taibaishanense]|nr:TraB/GumN family protein [Allorhizobium taibaishanense]MBB4009213.1 hypothetical protein [Allorhizobium taibaishanense]